MQVLLEKQFNVDASGVWVPHAGVQDFGYTDGRWVEQYLERVFRQSQDLSSGSEELEGYIKDWNTEYHLSRKRKDLLAGLTHHRGAKVLEIGSGCGAITRFLGERYDSVVAVEGSYHRARLARLRTGDLSSVDVVASKYQDMGLEGQFDIVFCIGVLEYAPTYVDDPDPFGHALASMRRMLKPGGTLVIAIENKLGLKYFANSREDHAGTFFEGIEGYPRTSEKFETFGRREFTSLLNGYWPKTEYYYPFPDYKMPTMLLSDETFDSIDAGEMLASLHERDYAGAKPAVFDNRLAWPEIARNGLAGEFSNSFLVVASSDDAQRPSMGGKLGVLFNRDRKAKYSTQSIIERSGDGIVVTKSLATGNAASGGRVRMQPSSSPWLDSNTVAYALFRRAHSPYLTLAQQIEPVRAWWNAILANSSSGPDGPVVSGNMIDAVWHNSCHMADGEVRLFDQELIWDTDMPARDLFLRSAFQWAVRYSKGEMRYLGAARSVTVIRRVARALDIAVSGSDLKRFARREAQLQAEIGTISERRAYRRIQAQLYVPHVARIKGLLSMMALQSRRARNLARRIVGK